MKRDWDLIRQLLIFIEQQDNQEIGDAALLGSKEAEHNMELLQDGGFIEAQSVKPLGGPTRYLSIRLTWCGQELLELIKPRWLWGETCQAVEKKELPKSLSVIRQVVERLASITEKIQPSLQFN